MKRSFLLLFLFILQLWLCFKGVGIFGIYINPVLILIVSMWVAIIYFSAILQDDQISVPRAKVYSHYDSLFILVLAGLLSACLFLFIREFRSYADTHTYSDVIRQLQALYDRSMRGEQPYYPVVPPSYAPFPVYMPLHWLPIGLAELCRIDLRVIGMLMLCLAIQLYCIYMVQRFETIWAKVLVIAMPIVILLSFYFCPGDIVYVFETPVAAYYLLLALGLSCRNLAMTTIGIICCLLSRYTMVFWLPLFAVLLWVHAPRRQNFIVWGSVIAAVLLIYVIPFYLRAPSALLAGLRYHNHAAIDEWTHFSTTFDLGINFAPHMRAVFTGDFAHRVWYARMVQGSAMIALLFGGLAAYSRVREKVNFYDFSLGMLYLVLLAFYIIGPLTYRYYLISLFFVAGMLCMKVFEYGEE